MEDVSKHWYTATGAGIGMILGYVFLSPRLGLVLGAAAGVLTYRIKNRKNPEG